MSNLGGLLFGGGDSGLRDYLTADQQKAMQRQAMMSAAASLLKSSGTSTVPISLGQALGGAYEAGTTGYQAAQQGAIQQLLTKQKLDEYKRQMTMQENIAKILGGGGTSPMPAPGAPITPEQAIAMPGLPAGPTVQRAEMIGQAAPAAPAMTASVMKANQYRQLADLMAALGKGEDAKRYLDIAENLAPSFEETQGDIYFNAQGQAVQRTKRGAFKVVPSEFAPMDKPTGTPMMMTDAQGKPVQVQRYESGKLQAITEFGVPREIVLEKLGDRVIAVDKNAVKPGQQFNMGLGPQVVGGAETGYFILGGAGRGAGGAGLAAPMPAPAGAPGAVVPPPVAGGAPRAPMAPAAGAAAPTGPQPIIPGTGKGFANEKDLRSEFTAQMKPYTELAQAFRKVEAAALNPSAAGDISLVYGYMKILDPGSTVMQGEQATAQNAGSVPERVRSMYNKALTGEGLIDTVRLDFYAQARNLIESQRQMAADVGDRYKQYADAYKLDSNQIVFDPFKRIKTPAEIAADAAKAPATAPASSGSWFDKFNLIKRPN
tara:strand:- start:1112 stop:2743 length:1632 start_codon:yes stop_codon:yes gene_type:complete